MSFAAYIAHGWKLCLISPGRKAPSGPAAVNWNTRERAITDPAKIPPGYGAGLCHRWSGTCALDIDNIEVAHAWLAERGIDLDALLLDPFSVQITSGRPGRAKLLYALPGPLASVKTAPFQAVSPKTGRVETYTALDFRCASKDGLTLQDVLPPSIHPDTGQPYAWKYGDELVGDWRNLPRLPAALEALWRSLLVPATSVPAQPVAPQGADLSELEALLETQDPDAAYNEWIRVGLALHHETQGSREGLLLWDRWSSRSAKYKGLADLEPHWRSFSASAQNPITLGSLRRERIASTEEFPIVPAGTTADPDYGEDTRPDAIMKRLLESRLVFVAGQDCYYDLAAKGDPWLSDRSLRHLFCPQMPEILVPGKNGAPDRCIRPDPVEYMKNSHTKLVVDGVGIHPGAPRIYEEDGKRWINRYTPRNVEPLRPLPRELEAFEFLWSRMKDDVFRRWLKLFYAHAVQKPGVKITAAPLLFSEATGTGKNTIAKLIPELLFGPQWVRNMSGDVLSDKFNDVVGETWWLYLEELRSGTTKVDRIHVGNKLKSWITDDFITVRAMYLKPFDIRNRLQITATSNFEDAVQLDNNDRRWAVCEMHGPLSEREGLDLYAVLRSERAPGFLHWIFRNVNLTGFNPTARAPVTVAKRVMIRAGIGQWESTLVERMVAGAPPFDRDVFYLRDVMDMMNYKGVSAVSLGRLLAKGPFFCKSLPNYNGQRMLCWRNYDEWVKFSDSERREYLRTGVRPSGNWSDEVPHLIRELSADAAVEHEQNHPCSDLI